MGRNRTNSDGVCRRCGAITRPRGVPESVRPNTRAAGSRGLCQSCYTRYRDEYDVERVVRTKEPTESIAQSPCVLVRVNLTPATYKALRRAGVESDKLGLLLAKMADQLAHDQTRLAS